MSEHGVLYDEHALLGAKFADIDADEGVLAVPAAYAAPGEKSAFEDGCALIDLAGMLVRLIHGGSAQQLVETLSAGRKLAVGEADYGAVLGGDGSLMSVALSARTGDDEYALFDLSARSRLDAGWIEFVAGMEQGGFKPFAGAEVEQVGDRLVPLMLWGKTAADVLADYLHDGGALPREGQVANVMLDKIETLAVGVPGLDGCWILMVPATRARVLWRSFLSFETVRPVGRVVLSGRLRESLPWYGALESPDQIHPTAKELRDQGLMRLDRDFIGARGLAG